MSPDSIAVVTSSEVEQDAAAVSFSALVSPVVLAWQDLVSGWNKRWMWSALALQDIRLLYRGSIIGPFWLTISTLVTVVSMGMIYPMLFHMGAGLYIPYLGLGMIVWQLLSTTINDGCQIFVRDESVIQQVPLPFSVHAYRNVCRNLLVFAHNMVPIPIGIVMYAVPIGWSALQVIPALALLALNGLWISILLGLVSTRFRDIPPIVASFLQVLFFLTPVIWPADALDQLRPLAIWNPFFAAIDVVRAPLLGQPVADTSWIILLVLTIAGWAAAFAMFVRFRTRIAYWI
jgi:ABC-type polysaccharide/polyol phosphate export permease